MILARDPLCKICNRYPSVIVDHVKPHKGDWDKFTDAANCQGLCKRCHDIKTAQEDGGFGNPRQQEAPLKPKANFGGLCGTTSALGEAVIEQWLAKRRAARKRGV
jgi:5-methylcytosine-specific restriction endonuclease McrA